MRRRLHENRTTTTGLLPSGFLLFFTIGVITFVKTFTEWFTTTTESIGLESTLILTALCFAAIALVFLVPFWISSRPQAQRAT